MSNPAKRSELAEQIELARQSIERWPGWLKDAAGVESVDIRDLKSSPGESTAGSESALPVSDSED